jgi:DNA-binding NtrC family response regulator
LRDRKEDIPVLANYFLIRFAAETKKNVTGISAAADEKLIGYDWPGNVRELANVIERAVVLGQDMELALSDLPMQIAVNGDSALAESLSYRAALDAAKREVVLRALAHTHGNRAAAARVLGVHKTHLLDLIKSLGIE